MDDHSPLPRYPVDLIIRQLMIIRESRSLKQGYVASRMRSTQTAISEMERGFVDPKLSRVRGYASALNLGIHLGDAQPFPDLEAMSVGDLLDLYHLMGEELERRVACPMTVETVDASS